MNRRRFVCFCAVLACAGALEVFRGPVHAQTPTTPVVLSSQAAPGVSGGSFSFFNQPVINNSGMSAFSAFMSGVSTSEDFGIWAGTASTGFTLAAREGHVAPGTGGAQFLTISQPLLDATGQIAFFGTLQGSGISGANSIGLWVGSPSGVQLAARTGDAAPGVSGGVFDFVSESALIASGRVAFFGSMATGGTITSSNDDGIWAGTVGSLQLVAREGSPAPGTESGVNYGAFNLTPVINASGAVAFRTTLTGTGIVTGVNDRGIWAGPAGGVAMVARAGGVAPELSGPTFADFSTQPTINSAGTVAFRATVTGAGVNSSNDTGIWVGSNASNLVVLAREGTDAPGLGTVKYGQIGDFVVLNSSGKVAFVAELQEGVDGTNNKAIFAGNVGAVGLVARKGNPASGTPSGVVFSDFDFSVALNTGGQVAFLANLSGAGVVAANNRGIWAIDPFGQMVKVAREGDGITIGPGDTRTIGDVGLGMFINSGGGEGRWTSFNDSSQLTFSAAFTNSTTGVFTARVGGSAQLNANAPVFGPATTNGYGTITPANYYETVPVSGDIGYLKFVGVSPAGQQVQILLDFSNTSVIANAIAELNRGADTYGYSVTPVSIGAFDVMLTFAGAGLGTTPQHFYWNFANVDDVNLVAIQVAPEPGAFAIMLLAGSWVTARRRRRVVQA